MEAHHDTNQLSSLTEWSVRHIRDIFEARTDEQSVRSIAATFSESLVATANGQALNREGLKKLVLSMRHGSPRGLKVSWQQAAEIPQDPSTNRNGSFDGVYVIRGIQKQLPGMSKPAEFERHKTVSVIIESESSIPHIDSRRIVSLAFVADDVRVDRQATL